MRRVLVTGANKGIGLAIVTAILSEQEDTFVLMGSRDRRRGEAARGELLEAHPAWASRLQVLELDVARDASVASAVERLRKFCPGEPAPLYGLVNNAGIGGGSAGLAEVLEVNLLGVRRMCEACLPLLDHSQGRIVNVTSASGPSFVASCSPERQRFFVNPALEWADLRAFLDECLAIEASGESFASRGLGDGNAYGLSTACANTYTVLLARKHPDLRINACTPGFIETDMTRRYAESSGKSPAELGMKPPSAGARAPLFLLFGEPEGSGRYYGSDARRSPLDRYRAPGSEPYRG